MAEIYGSFGRVITGNTLGGSIGSLARQIMSDKIRRIFQAYRDETSFEGSLITAEVAISKLESLLGTVGNGSEAAQDIKEYIDLIRQEDRTRRVNKAVTELSSQDAATKDYAKLIATMKGVLTDTTITETEKETLKAAIATQTRNYLNLLLTQFQDGKSVTVNGKVINFDIESNSDSIVGLVEGLIAENPDMAGEFGPSLEISRAFTIIKKAQFDAAKVSDATDAGRLQSERLMLKAYESAAALMQKSKYDVLQTDEYLKILEYLDTTKGNIATYEKNAAAKVAGEKVQKGDDKIGAVLDQIDKFGAKVLKGTQSGYLSGYKSLTDLMTNRSVTIDEIDDYLDAIARNNGGERFFTNADGEKISFDMFAVGGYIKDAYNTALSMVKYANSQEGMKEWANHFKEIASGMITFVQNGELFTAEDKYDAARKRLESDMESSDGDIFAMRAAYQRFGNTVKGIAQGVGEGSSIYDNLMQEGEFFVTGETDENRLDFYGEISGNFVPDDTDAEYLRYLNNPADIHKWATETDRSQLVTYRDISGKEVTLPPTKTEYVDEFGNDYEIPAWGANAGIMAKDNRGRKVVNQLVPAFDSKGGKVGWFSIINGKVIAGKFNGNDKLGFFSTADINRALSGANLNANTLVNLLSGMGDTFGIRLTPELLKLFGESTKKDLTIFEALNGGFEEGGLVEIGGSSDPESLDNMTQEWFKGRDYSVTNVSGVGWVIGAYDDNGNWIDVKTQFGEKFFQDALRLWGQDNLEGQADAGAGASGSTTTKPEIAVSGAGGAGGRGTAGMGWTPAVKPTAPTEPTRSIGSSGYVTTTGPEKPQTPLTQGATTPTSPVSSYLLTTQANVPTTTATGVPYNMPTPPKPTPKPYSPPPPSTRRDPTGTGLTRDTAWGIGGYGTAGAGGSGGFFRNSPSKIAL
jgi:hypothetical protein